MKIKAVSKETYHARVIDFRIFLIILGLAFLVLTIFAKIDAYFYLDLVITKSIQQIRYSWFEGLMKGMSWLGYPLPGSILIVTVSLLVGYLLRKKDGVALFVSSFGAVLLSEVFKIIVSRPRPDPTLVSQLDHYTRSDSFPSGHVLLSMGFFGFLLFLSYGYLTHKLFRILVISICALLIILMGVSRIYVGAHWFSDTLGAYILGTIWLYLVVIVYHKKA